VIDIAGAAGALPAVDGTAATLVLKLVRWPSAPISSCIRRQNT